VRGIATTASGCCLLFLCAPSLIELASGSLHDVPIASADQYTDIEPTAFALAVCPLQKNLA
jgi:hypothetical protein